MVLRIAPAQHHNPHVTGPAPRWGRLPEILLLVSVGLLLTSLSYAGGRQHLAWSEALFWVGQSMMFLPVMWRLLSPGMTREREAFGLTAGLTLMYYVVKYCYSPLEFKFPDELQHWRTTQDILLTKHLLAFNYSMPISPVYPGLENLTSAVISTTGLSIFTGGLVVGAAARLLLTVGIYLFFREISNSIRLAGIASVLFTTAPHYKFINGMYIYGTLAFPFLALSLYAAVRLTTAPRERNRRMWWAFSTVFIGLTVITHHVTSYALIATLGLAAVTFVLSRRVAQGLVLAALAGIGLAFVVLWVVLVAPYTIDYLWPIVSRLVEGASGVTAGRPPPSSGTQQSPLYNQAISYLGVFVVMACLPIGWYGMWRTRPTDFWPWAMAVGSSAYYLTVVLRLVSASGPDHAARAMTYAYVPVCYVLAAAAEALLAAPVDRRVTFVAALVPAGIIAASGLTIGWPAYWERIPGRYVFSAFESAVTREGVLTARWSLAWLYSGNRVAADISNYTLMGTYGQQDAVRDMSQLYYSPQFRDSDRELVEKSGIRYAVVDHRMTLGLPIVGYFPDDTMAGRHVAPLSTESLDKFDHVSGVGRVYDGGNIVIYDFKGSRYAPYATYNPSNPLPVVTPSVGSRPSVAQGAERTYIDAP